MYFLEPFSMIVTLGRYECFFKAYCPTVRDSGSEHCQLSPHYALSPPDLEPGHGDAVDTVANITLYNDPVLFQGQSRHTHTILTNISN